MADTPQIRQSVHVLISGRVQGVGFRYWTHREARRLGLGGWVRNRRDGTVEAVFAGDAEAVAEMLRLCKEGPSYGYVADVTVTEEGGDIPLRFEVRETV